MRRRIFLVVCAEVGGAAGVAGGGRVRVRRVVRTRRCRGRFLEAGRVGRRGLVEEVGRGSLVGKGILTVFLVAAGAGRASYELVAGTL